MKILKDLKQLLRGMVQRVVEGDLVVSAPFVYMNVFSPRFAM